MTLSILSIVILISTFVQIYSLTYMKEDPYKIKFLIYLILFTWFMIVLVMSENLITFFLGWEGVGLVSYLLISFWNTRIQANKSSIKAILINKIGDIGLIIFITITIKLTRSINFHEIYLIDSIHLINNKI